MNHKRKYLLPASCFRRFQLLSRLFSSLFFPSPTACCVHLCCYWNPHVGIGFEDISNQAPTAPSGLGSVACGANCKHPVLTSPRHRMSALAIPRPPFMGMKGRQVTLKLADGKSSHCQPTWKSPTPPRPAQLAARLAGLYFRISSQGPWSGSRKRRKRKSFSIEAERTKRRGMCRDRRREPSSSIAAGQHF